MIYSKVKVVNNQHSSYFPTGALLICATNIIQPRGLFSLACIRSHLILKLFLSCSCDLNVSTCAKELFLFHHLIEAEKLVETHGRRHLGRFWW